MPDRRTILTAAFLAVQAGAIYWAATGERVPTPPDLEKLAPQFGGWVQVRQEAIDADIRSQLGADRLLSRSYFHVPAGPFANLFVAWFGSQRDGTRQPHSPKVCLPGNGWIPEVAGVVTINTAAGAITVNRYIIQNRGARAIVLYWYQTPRRVIAGEWDAKFWLAADALRDRRTDTAIVRVALAIPPGQDAAATAAATAFVRRIYPLLRANLPR
ncbi:MAG: exosortase C-terminal domain/associated protein EpsI [Bryobacteraceae bacterium]|jgi:EpsI family protein